MKKSYEISAVSGLGVGESMSSCLTSYLHPQQPTQKSYTRDEALKFLIERLDRWPTNIAGAPRCLGWGWALNGNYPDFEELNPDNPEFQSFICIDSWRTARSALVPFASVEDEQPVAGKKFDAGKPI
ncbi:MAG: hypothetical protein ACRCT2_00075, partial [Plesiomonas shigelloides]